MPLRPELRLYDTSGARQPLPDAFIGPWSFELLPMGGCGTFSLVVYAELDDTEIPALPANNWRLDVWMDDGSGPVPVYRGWFENVEPTLGEALYRCQGVGLMGRMGAWLVDVAYAKAYGADVSELFAWLAESFLTGDERVGTFQRAIARDLGYEVDRADFFGSNMREAFDRLAEESQDSLLWGWDVFAANGRDRLYVQPRPESVTNEDYRFRIGKDVSYYQQPESLAEVVNAVRIVGGEAKLPNLVYNPSFELPKVPGSGAEGNLVTNPSFELGPDDFGPADDWDDSGGFDLRQPDDSQEYARTGEWLAELGEAGRWMEQDVPVTNPGIQPYAFAYHCALEDPPTGSPPHLRVQIKALDGGGSPIGGDLVDDTREVSARAYRRHRYAFTTPAGTEAIRIRITNTDGGADEDVLVDDVWLYQSDVLVQRGWKQNDRGAASGQVDWASEDDPYHGSYCVKAVTSDVSGSDDTVRIQPTNAHYAAARELTSYTVRVRVRAEAALDLRLGIQIHGGEEDYDWGSVETLAGDGSWELIEATGLNSGDDGSKVRPIIELRSNGAYALDAVELLEEGIVTPLPDIYLDGERVNYYFRADDGATLPDLSDEALASIETYGLREKVVDVEEITTPERAKAYATGYLNRFAIPQRRGLLVLNPADVLVRFVSEDGGAPVQGRVAIAGAGVSIPNQLPARIFYAVEAERGGAVRCEVELTNRRYDPALILQQALMGSSEGGGTFLGSGSIAGRGGSRSPNLEPRPTNTQPAPEIVPAGRLSSALQDALPDVEISVGAEAGNVIQVSVQFRDATDTTLAARMSALVWLADAADTGPSATAPSGGWAAGAGYKVRESTVNLLADWASDGTGLVRIDITHVGARTWYLHARVGDRVYVSGAVAFV